ncbi:MAG: NAD(P)/FAD-dependent oxidoreductase [Candidatus Hodarchaeota archaeon]
MPHEVDLLIIGAGPAGLTAALYGARMGLNTTVLEADAFGGLASTAPKIDNYPGFSSIGGFELAEQMKTQAEHWGAEVLKDAVTAIDPKAMLVSALEGQWKAKAIIIATGSKHRKLGLPNESELKGDGISYCATCDGPTFRGRTVAAVGGGNSAGLETIYLSGLATRVYLIHRRERMRAEKAIVDEVLSIGNVIPMFNCTVEEAIPDESNKLRKLKIKNHKTNEIIVKKVKGLFIAIGEEPQSALAKAAGVELDKNGYIRVNRKQETNIKGIYAAGDVTGGIRQVTTAVGEATTAAMQAYLFIKQGWYGTEAEA